MSTSSFQLIVGRTNTCSENKGITTRDRNRQHACDGRQFLE